MRKFKFILYILRAIGFVVLLLPLITFRGCMKDKYSHEKKRLDSLIDADSLLLQTSLSNLSKDSIKYILKERIERKNKIINADASYNWDTIYGFAIPIQSIDLKSSSYESKSEIAEIILIDLLLLSSLAGLILLIIRRFRKYKILRLTSVINILSILVIIIIASLYHKFIRIEICVWIALLINLLSVYLENRMLKEEIN